MFTAQELKRVGTACTMLVVCGTIVILAMTMMLGHYNSLAHAGPKAAIDGAVIALLIGQRGRWRCLTLLGAVYGLVLLLQVGVIYLLPVTVMAAGIGALAGRCIEPLHRPAAIILAAVVYELLAGSGAPIKIYFGTGGRNEPFLWSLWFAEWPLRIVGASLGVWLSSRIHRADGSIAHAPTIASTSVIRRIPRAIPAALALLMSILACTVPLFLESPWVLGGIAIVFVVYALSAGIRWGLLHAGLAMLWGWAIFGIFSYAWNRDLALVMDLWRTLVLRFAPLTLASIVIVAAVRPIDMLRLLRRLLVPAAVLLPLATVLRSLPHARLTLHHSIQTLRDQGHWRGPASLFCSPVTIFRALLVPQLRHWAGELADDPAALSARER